MRTGEHERPEPNLRGDRTERFEERPLVGERVAAPAGHDQEQRDAPRRRRQRLDGERSDVVAIRDERRVPAELVELLRVVHVAATVDEDLVVARQVVVCAELGPHPEDRLRAVEHVAQPKDETRLAAHGRDRIEQRLDLAKRANGHVVDQHDVRLELPERLEDELPAQTHGVRDGDWKAGGPPFGVAGLYDRRQLQVVDPGERREERRRRGIGHHENAPVRIALEQRDCQVAVPPEMTEPHAVLAVHQHAHSLGSLRPGVALRS